MLTAVLGAGGVGLGTAALLAQSGHQVALWSPSQQPGPVTLESQGAVAGRFPVRATNDVADAVAGADMVVVALPGWAHRTVLEAMAPVLQDGQTVLISSHASLGALHLHRLLAGRGCRAMVAAWGTTIVTGRRTGPHACTLSNIRTAVDMAAIPASRNEAAFAACRDLFGDRFVQRTNLLAIQLSNVNPQNHLAMLLCNLTRAERGEAWGNYWAITQAVGRLMEALDAERLALAREFGVAVRTVREHFHLSFGVPMAPVWEQAAMVHARGGTPNGPATLDTRYITEDVPYGIAVTEWLAGVAGVPAPLHAAGAALFCALTGRDLRAENDLLPALGLGGVSAAALLRLCG